MISNNPFLVACGKISEFDMMAGSIALSEVWGGKLKEVSSSESPDKVLNNLSKGKGLLLLNGDAGMCLPGGGSWIESFGDWKHPIILFVSPLPSGEIPGIGHAYVAMSQKYSVPLIGIVQLGGLWSGDKKSLDKLPWCGRLPLQRRGNTKSINEEMDSYIVL